VPPQRTAKSAVVATVGVVRIGLSLPTHPIAFASPERLAHNRYEAVAVPSHRARHDPVMERLLERRRDALLAALAVLVLLVVAGRVLARSGTPREAIPLKPAPLARRPGAVSPIVVDVAGGVRRPGVYRFRDGARVADAVERAGGPTPKAMLAQVNLAERLADGEQVVIPLPGVPAAPAGSSSGASDGPVHLGSATLEQLDSLPGVGPVTAQRILDYRSAHGGFKTVEELDAVPGIGPARFAQLRELVAP